MRLQYQRVRMRHDDLTPGAVMDQIRFTITPYYNGWRVDDGLRDRDWFGRLEDAVASADTLARMRHALTGTVTVVVVQDGVSAPRVLSRHG